MRSDVLPPRFYPPLRLDIDRGLLPREPALTLATAEAFAAVAPPLAVNTSLLLLEMGALDEILDAVRRRGDLDLRITSFAVHLDAGDVSSSRYDWHIDRIGQICGTGAGERWDATDYTRSRSFLSFSAFYPDLTLDLDDVRCRAGTEFVVEPSLFRLDGGWHSNASVQAAITQVTRANFLTRMPVNMQPVGFGARHVHRPGRAPMKGWRLFIRLGAYRNVQPCSPYEDHLPTAIPVTREEDRFFRLRPLGSSSSVRPDGPWSIAIIDESTIRDHLDRYSLEADAALGRRFKVELRERLDGLSAEADGRSSA